MVLRSLHARRGRRPLLPRPRRQDQQRAEAEQLPAVAAGVLGARSSVTSCGLILGRTSTSGLRSVALLLPKQRASQPCPAEMIFSLSSNINTHLFTFKLGYLIFISDNIFLIKLGHC
ncbi:hypothetical protein GQ55_2G356700 [Panicum hallii var. hallii]|uniref:Uncharacterized protein n=1 Tax=Panicum hallii var. hallii TaxID=1504633 RepID=A0A2T7EVW6_9POAL|nr:hypothetical protein GQ55_2G356700 [Panicum hallii var. hallii]